MSKRVRALKKSGVVVALTALIGICLKATILAAGESSREAPATTSKVSAAPEPAGVATEKEASAEGKAREQRLTLWRIIELGGFLMYPLLGLSVAAVAMVTYFLLAFSPGNIMPPEFLRRLQQILRDKKIDEARVFCARNRNVVSHIIRSGLDVVDKGPRGVLEAMNNEGSRRTSSLWLQLSFLSDIAVVAPMIGLLGTVVGMFQAFMTVAPLGPVSQARGMLINPSYLTKGVAMAVITTIAGLMIAIPATMAYSYFRAAVQKTVLKLEVVCSRYSDMIVEASQ